MSVHDKWHAVGVVSPVGEKIKAYMNSKRNGFRAALELAEGKKSVIDDIAVRQKPWQEAVAANGALFREHPTPLTKPHSAATRKSSRTCAVHICVISAWRMGCTQSIVDQSHMVLAGTC